MASINGTTSPPANEESSNSPNTPSAKRKRDDTNEAESALNGNSDSKTHVPSASSVAASTEYDKGLVRDLIDVMKEYDTNPSILDRSLPEHSLPPTQVKRQKTDDANEQQTSIMTRFLLEKYRDVDEVLRDIDSAVSDITVKLQLPNGGARNQYSPISQSQSEFSMKVASFKKRAHELVNREKAAVGKGSQVRVPGTKSSLGYGGVGPSALPKSNSSSEDNKVVLTLYGNAPLPKQLFSSLQLQTKIPGEQTSIIQTLREAGLPNGITTTKIVPVQATGLIDDKKRVPTLGEIFPTPASVPPLAPPKPSKVATTRSSVVGWYNTPANDATSRGASYFRQPVSAGQWLDYSKASSVLQGAKRKQRERGLSLVGGKSPVIDTEPPVSDAAKLDALFKSAYCGFAPTKDDSAAVVPAGVVERMWWSEVGEKTFQRMVENASNLALSANPTVAVDDADENDDELIKFEQMVEDMEKDGIDPSLVQLDPMLEKSIEEKEVEEILEGISDLLATLNSYQRIRHSSLNSVARPAGLLSTTDTAFQGTPSKPGDSEQATYEILKSQLSLMIASLPPYAVAKIDPDRLAELSISTKIEVPMTDYKGIMEEDEASVRARTHSLTQTAAVTHPRTQPTAHIHRAASSTSLYGNQYSASRPAAASPSPYYGQTQTPIRPPSSNVPRPPATAPVYANQRPAAAAPYRPGPSYGTPTYPHQAPRPVQQPYASATQQYLQTPSGQPYMRPPSQNFQHMPQSVPQASVNGRYPGQQPSYPHQSTPAQQNGMSYQYNSANTIHRQTSPQKPAYSPQPSAAQPRPSYSTPTPPLPQSRQYPPNQMGQQPGSMNGSSALQTPQSHFAHPPSNLTNYSTFMTTEQQSSMMERQRAQLAAQQAQAQQQARNAAQAAMGSTPNAQVNGGNPVAAGS